MTQFARNIAVAAAVLAGTTGVNASIVNPGDMPMAPEVAFQPEVIMAQARPRSGFNGNWYIAPNGCAYSRAQAPGSAPMWILIQNPHHLGLPNASPDCARTL